MSKIFDSLRSVINNTGDKTSKNPQRIKADELKQWLEQEKPPLLLDVRSSEEYKQAHIPGSKLLPMHLLPAKLNELTKHKDLPVVVYCASGARSGQAANFLVKNGFNKVYDMGGIFSWPYQVEK